MSKSEMYNGVSRLLHWGLAALIIGMLALGLYMSDLEFSPTSVKLYGYHKAFGFVVLVLVAVRLLWRFTHRTPPLPSDMSRFEKRAAKAGHIALYAAMFIMPLSGWAMSSAYGFPVSVFNLFLLPNITSKSTELAGFFHEVHEISAFALIALIIGHFLAAMYHHFIRKDGVLRRMLWGAVLGITLSSTASLAYAQPAETPKEPRWVLQKDFSYIEFMATVNGAPSGGKFTHYTADLQLDEKDLTQTRGTISVSLSEIDAAYPMVGTTLQKKDWFHTAKWPDGVFEIVEIRQDEASPSNYLVLGKLKLRATTHPLTLKMHIEKQTADELIFTGTGTIERLKYGVGQGEWASTSTVKNNVELDIKAVFKAF